jgi:hypothetical protein
MTQTIRRELRQKFQDLIEKYNIRGSVDIDYAEAMADAALEVRGIALATDDTKGEYNIPAIVTAANKSVDAMLNQERQNATKLTYPKRESLPEPIRELIDAFVIATNIKPRAKETLGWLGAGQDWLNLRASADDVLAIIEYAKDKFTITTPFSITNVLRTYKAGGINLEATKQEPKGFNAIRGFMAAHNE